MKTAFALATRFLLTLAVSTVFWGVVLPDAGSQTPAPVAAVRASSAPVTTVKGPVTRVTKTTTETDKQIKVVIKTIVTTTETTITKK